MDYTSEVEAINIEIHTDGSIVPKNPGGAGGWAAVVIAGSRTQLLSGCIEAPTTNNRAELMGVINSLRLFRRPTNITLYSDSEYVLNPLAKRWIDKWAARDFRKKKPGEQGSLRKGVEEMPNADLWRMVNELDIRHNIVCVHERGHKGNEHNETCHEEALTCARIAWESHELGVPLVDIPSTLEAKQEYLEMLKRCPQPPDPPVVSPLATWAVFERESKYIFKEKPAMMPMTPSNFKDNARSYCEEAARVMNQSVWQDRKHPLVGGEPMFEARPLNAPLDSREAS